MAGPTTLFQSGVHASRPAAGAGCVLYSCTTHSLVYRSDGSAWTTWMTIPAGASMATDTIWDAAGDLAVGSGADTAARLALAQGKLARVGGSLGYDSGSSFPGSPSSGDRYWRSDLAMEFYNDGTRWLSTTLYELRLPVNDVVQPFSATQTSNRTIAPALGGGSDIWLVDERTNFFVNGGTALGASHKWVGTYTKSANGSSATPITVNIDSGASGAWRSETQAVNALMNNGTTYLAWSITWTKTGTPGTLLAVSSITYRIVAT